MKKLFFTIIIILNTLLSTAQTTNLTPLVPDSLLLQLLIPNNTATDRKISIKTIVGNDQEIRVRLSDGAKQLPLSQKNIATISDSIRLWCNAPNASVTLYTSEANLSQIAFSDTAWAQMPVVGSPVQRLDPFSSAPMLGRNIALWPSHGRYYEKSYNRWEWQRGRLYTTVEDLLTPSFVLPFLIPMLENAGCSVFTPRERDTSPSSCIVDNDDVGFLASKDFLRQEKGWAHFDSLKNDTNPFSLGTANVYDLSPEDSISFSSSTESSGLMMLYVAFSSSLASSDSVLVSVHHAGGVSHFLLNQQRGGNMWLPIARLPFKAGRQWRVVFRGNGLISADAVRIGGGMGSYVAPCGTSGMPAWAEGARYYLLSDGFDYKKVVSLSKGENDYTDDINSRGEWVNALINDKNIPIDACFALHTDAGVTYSDSTIGTLSIITTDTKNGYYPDGRSTQASRQLAGHISTSVVNDIRRAWDADWTSRGITDKNYSESRRPNVPSVLLELLSHQNLSEIKLALHPAFRHDVSRAIYKALLHYVCGPTAPITPLPPSHFGITFADTTDVDIVLSWRATPDSLEASATTDTFLIFRDDHFLCATTDTLISLQEKRDGLIHMYHIVAFGPGGRSLPSASLPVCLWGGDGDKKALLIEGQDRLSAPATILSEQWTGILADQDAGVALDGDVFTTGDQHDFDPHSAWQDDDAPGCGASYSDREMIAVRGTGSRLPSPVARLLRNAGYSFVSQSKDYFDADSLTQEEIKNYALIRIALGLQRSTPYGDFAPHHAIFTPGFRQNIESIKSAETPTIITGNFIGSDLPRTKEMQAWGANNLGMKPRTSRASKTFQISASPQWLKDNLIAPPAPDDVWHLQVDAIEPTGSAKTIIRYVDSQMSAAIQWKNFIIAGF